MNGSIAAAVTGSSLQGSVTASQPMLARNNRGSNVTIPYARVVMHPTGNTALPPTPLELSGAGGVIGGAPLTTLGRPASDLMIETEMLSAGRVAFVLGRRGKNYTQPFLNGVTSNQQSQQDGTPRVPFRQANQLAAFAVGGSDVNTCQRMCSFEYLERYFYFALKNKAFAVGGGGGMVGISMTLSPDVLKARQQIVGMGSIVNVDGKAILDEIGRKNKLAVVHSASLVNSGIYLADEGPFLRGKTLETALSKIGHNRAPLSASIGDIVAFGRLQEMIAQSGACDWVADGVVHTKLSQGDQIMDEQLDSRDGQLFNITVGGPAISSSWTNDKHLEVMPLDKVFVVIVADVWDGKDEVDVHPLHNANDDGTYEEALLTAVATATNIRNPGERTAYFRNAGAKAVVTNMRVRLTTSSEMVSSSVP